METVFINYKKGLFFKSNKSKYMIIDFIENEYNLDIALAIRVSNKCNRFDIKHLITTSEKSLKKGYNEVIKEINIDKRDKEIFDDFVNYMTLNNFKIETNVSSQYYSYMNNTYYHVSKKRIVNANFKKYKLYMKTI